MGLSNSTNKSTSLAGVVSPRERVAQLKKLSETAASATPAQRQQVSDQLSASFRREKDPLIRLEIIRTLGHYPGPAADAILKAALSDSEARNRAVACEAWGKRNDAGAVGQDDVQLACDRHDSFTYWLTWRAAAVA